MKNLLLLVLVLNALFIMWISQDDEQNIESTAQAKEQYIITLQDGTTMFCSDYYANNCGITIDGEDCSIEGGLPAYKYVCHTNVTIRRR